MGRITFTSVIGGQLRWVDGWVTALQHKSRSNVYMTCLCTVDGVALPTNLICKCKHVCKILLCNNSVNKILLLVQKRRYLIPSFFFSWEWIGDNEDSGVAPAMYLHRRPGRGWVKLRAPDKVQSGRASLDAFLFSLFLPHQTHFFLLHS